MPRGLRPGEGQFSQRGARTILALRSDDAPVRSFKWRQALRKFGGTGTTVRRARRNFAEGVARLASIGDTGSMKSLYRGHRFPSEIISHAVWLYHRLPLSFRDVADILAEFGVTDSYEAIRLWCRTFGPDFGWNLRRRHGRPSDLWHVDEVFITIRGECLYLWRAVDQDGDVLDVPGTRRWDARAA